MSKELYGNTEVVYDNETIASLEPGEATQLDCAGKLMKTGVKVANRSKEVSSTPLEGAVPVYGENGTLPASLIVDGTRYEGAAVPIPLLEKKLEGVGAKLALALDPSSYVLTVRLLNEDGTELSTQSVDLPLEMAFVAAELNDGGTEIVFTLQNGSTVSVPVATIAGDFSIAQSLGNSPKKVISQAALTEEILPVKNYAYFDERFAKEKLYTPHQEHYNTESYLDFPYTNDVSVNRTIYDVGDANIVSDGFKTDAELDFGSSDTVIAQGVTASYDATTNIFTIDSGGSSLPIRTVALTVPLTEKMLIKAGEDFFIKIQYESGEAPNQVYFGVKMAGDSSSSRPSYFLSGYDSSGEISTSSFTADTDVEITSFVVYMMRAGVFESFKFKFGLGRGNGYIVVDTRPVTRVAKWYLEYLSDSDSYKLQDFSVEDAVFPMTIKSRFFGIERLGIPQILFLPDGVGYEPVKDADGNPALDEFGNKIYEYTGLKDNEWIEVPFSVYYSDDILTPAISRAVEGGVTRAVDQSADYTDEREGVIRADIKKDITLMAADVDNLQAALNGVRYDEQTADAIYETGLTLLRPLPYIFFEGMGTNFLYMDHSNYLNNGYDAALGVINNNPSLTCVYDASENAFVFNGTATTDVYIPVDPVRYADIQQMLGDKQYSDVVLQPTVEYDKATSTFPYYTVAWHAAGTFADGVVTSEENMGQAYDGEGVAVSKETLEKYADNGQYIRLRFGEIIVSGEGYVVTNFVFSFEFIPAYDTEVTGAVFGDKEYPINALTGYNADNPLALNVGDGETDVNVHVKYTDQASLETLGGGFELPFSMRWLERRNA